MHYSLATTIDPIEEPLTLEEAKIQSRVDADAEDALITALIVAARIWCEDYQGRAYVNRGYELRVDVDDIPAVLSLKMPPIVSLDSIVTEDEDGIQTDITEYTLLTSRNVPALTDITLPTDCKTLVVRYTAGYGNGAEYVPQTCKQAMLLLIGQWYANREAAGQQQYEVPFSVMALLNPDRVNYGF